MWYHVRTGDTMTKYEKIYNDLVSKIQKEVYTAGDLLPGELELMKIYDASRDTIRKSLNLLVQNGYIQKSKGRGSIVLDVKRFEFPVSGVISFKELIPSLGDVETRVNYLFKTKADQRFQTLLNLGEDDEIWMLQRIRYVNGEAVILDTDVFNAQIIKNLPMEAAQNSVYEYIENELNLTIAYADKEITCEPLTGEDQRYLDMKDFDMIVDVQSQSYLDDARIFQYTSSRHRPDKFRFREFARRVKQV